ncbi:IclR family transcriptional regulator [Magnetospirillum sulfuroxidans]|uniref:IclR family transcriptional regulator n=1 Tax=Magnetospirillum sulfuroxidans TaxID=611300 RepID=A0ABS5I935_9PROT|nr:IclR family transcriptional regulator [Magnetospirillum sulfuroxidans]MBR9970238.1 IclR family transcriptional regulator [Magnetospirillum sulfuroxidans]
MSEASEGKHGVQSIEIGMQVLRALAGGERAMMLKDIAAIAGMPASKAHRYLVSLIRAGMVEQDRETSLYDLGPLALHVGLAAIDRLDRIQLGLNAIAELRDRVNETTALSVWSENGPIIVRGERPRRAITVNVVTGTALDVLSSASGQIFAAYLPREQISKLIETELSEGRAPVGADSWPAIETMFERVRQTGISAVSGYHLVPGVEAVGAPVFNAGGDITLTMLVVGIQGMFDMRPEGQVVRELIAAANTLSERLGSSRRIVPA